MGKNIMIIFTIILSTLLISGCANQIEVKKISLENTDSLDGEQKKERKVLEIGVGAMVSPKDTLVNYQEILDYVSRKLGYDEARMVQRSTYDEMNSLVKNEEVDFAFVCAGPYVEGKKEFGMQLIAAPQMYGEPVYYSYIIVNKDSNYTKLKDLQGKKFAFTDPKSNTGAIVPKYELAKINQTPEKFFGELIYSGSHDKSVESVGRGIVDGAAVDHLIWEFMDKKGSEFTKKTKIIEKLGPFCIPPFVASPKADPALVKKMKEILLTLHETKEGKALLDKIYIDKFVEVKDDCYQSVRDMQDWLDKQK